MLGERLCEGCGQPLEPGRPRNAVFHKGGACKQRTYRRRVAGVPRDAHLPHGRRGRVGLADATTADALAALRGAAVSLADLDVQRLTDSARVGLVAAHAIGVDGVSRENAAAAAGLQLEELHEAIEALGREWVAMIPPE